MACAACKTIPPVVVEGYEPKGKYEEIGGLKTYVVGDASQATRALIDIYDIFGLSNQILQGADSLAAALDAVVLVPDFLDGNYGTADLFGDQLSPEQQATKEALFAKVFNFPPYVEKLRAVAIAGKAKYPNVTGWGAVGLCWGGKPTVLLSGQDTVFKATAQVHPAGLAKEDAEKVTIPHYLLASNGEDVEVVKQYHEIIEGGGKGGKVETYAHMHHGWMGARAKLADAENLKEYESGYNKVAAFFAKHL